jgi:CubicO group peptidase (beta-lactamase class C family)
MTGKLAKQVHETGARGFPVTGELEDEGLWHLSTAHLSTARFDDGVSRKALNAMLGCGVPRRFRLASGRDTIMKHPRNCVLILLGLLAAGCDEGSDKADIPERFRKLAYAIEQERVALGAPGVAFAVVEHGEVTFAHGFGTKDASKPDPVLPTTLFRIGSCTKMLTSIGVLQTVDQGLVSLDDPVSKHLPGFHLTKTPEAAASIKVRHLLSHTSGLFDYGETNAPAAEQTDASLSDFVTGRMADLEYVASPPGAVYAYANLNFTLAGLVAESASETQYRRLMHDRVFAPLGMHRTVFLPSEVLADGDYAVGANCQDQGDPRCFATNIPEAVQPDSYDNPWLRPAGFAWSSVLDLAQVARFLVHGQADVLSEAVRSQMISAQVSTREAGDISEYGFGVQVLQGFGDPKTLPYRSLKVVLHAGDIPGFSADISCLPALDFCMIALANANSAHFQNSAIVGLNTLLDLPPADTMPDTAAKPERYPLYAGTYDDVFGVGTVKIASQGGELTIDIPSLDASGTPYQPELQPIAIDNFILNAGGVQRPLTFIADETGTYRYVRSRPYVAPRAQGN